jgi:hypothetical protein
MSFSLNSASGTVLGMIISDSLPKRDSDNRLPRARYHVAVF